MADHALLWPHAMHDHNCDYSHAPACVERLIGERVVVGMCCDTSGEMHDLFPQVISLPLDTAKVRLQLQAKGAITPKYKCASWHRSCLCIVFVDSRLGWLMWWC